MTMPSNDARHALFGDRNFRWLLCGGLLSMLGDQFSMIALPWLVLKMTADPMVLGTVLAVMSLPRAVFILVGGALVDRHSARQILQLTKFINAALLATLALLTWSGALQLWMVYALALALGLASAFSYPAGSAVLPQCLPPTLLQPANGVLMGLRQFAVLIGPVLAGVLVSLLDDARGLALAFGFDAFSFIVSAWTLAQVRMLPRVAVTEAALPVLSAIRQALQAMWDDVALRSLCLYFAAIGFFVGGPLQVALPVLASTQLAGGAASLGLLLAGHGAGALGGMAFSGLRPNWRLKTLGGTVLAIDAIAGLVFLPFGHIHATWQGLALLIPLGALGGFVQVAVFTWMQQRVAPAMLGRAMSLFMFLFMGLAPLSAALAGAAMRWLSPADLFTASGAMLLVIVALGAILTPVREIRDVVVKSA